MREGIKSSVRRKMMIAWIYPKIAKSAPVILVEEVGWVLLFVWEALLIARHHRFIKG